MTTLLITELRKQLEWLKERRIWSKEVDFQYRELKEFLEKNCPEQPELFANYNKKEI